MTAGPAELHAAEAHMAENRDQLKVLEHQIANLDNTITIYLDTERRFQHDAHWLMIRALRAAEESDEPIPADKLARMERTLADLAAKVRSRGPSQP